MPLSLPIYQLDAFTDTLFGGNPAAVVPLQTWLPDATMQAIAAENNLAETAFYVPTQDGFHLRWFTPVVEVDLCGHATLATAFVIFNLQNYAQEVIRFESRSGELTVRQQDDWLVLDFPADTLHTPSEIPEALLPSLGNEPVLEVLKGKTDYLVVFENQAQIESLQPDFRVMNTVAARGVIVTAKGNKTDFVSRFFAPQSGIDEDPVTGSAHTTLTPYWASQLNKNEFEALQLSARGGFLKTKLNGQRVEIAGQVKLYLQGQIFVS
jgi:PhzF family phenazine biosynthesis protein